MRMRDILTELSLPPDIGDASPILRRAGWDQIGSGYWAQVYGKEGVDYVLKLFDPRDRGYLAFLDLIRRHPNPHFPKIKSREMRITDKYSAVRMELLQPATNAPKIGLYLFCRDKGPNPRNEYQVEAYEEVCHYLDDHRDLRAALDLIIDNLLTKYRDDLHTENVMKRADGTLVIIDPVTGNL